MTKGSGGVERPAEMQLFQLGDMVSVVCHWLQGTSPAGGMFSLLCTNLAIYLSTYLSCGYLYQLVSGVLHAGGSGLLMVAFAILPDNESEYGWLASVSGGDWWEWKTINR